MINITLKEGIHWVGYVDWSVRDFHGYETNRGSTYNAYLILDECPTLIDTVKEPFGENLLNKVASLIPLDSIRYLVCNHAEPDHAGAMQAVLNACPNAAVLCNKKCQNALSKHFDVSNWKFQIVNEGEFLSIGKRNLVFYNTPMAHWPESMATYVPEEKIFFSMDAFGQHFSSSGRFDDQEPFDDVMFEAATYYANILMPYGKAVRGAIEKASQLDIDIIAPSHGVIWRKHIKDIIQAYLNWSEQKPAPKVIVVYDTMWMSTSLMARAIYEGSLREGVCSKLIYCRASHITHIATDMLDSAAVAFGSPTLNRVMMPQMAAVLKYLEGLRPSNKAALAFGSYGWMKGGPHQVEKAMSEMGFDIIHPTIDSNYRPTEEILETCRKAGALLADKAVKLCENF